MSNLEIKTCQGCGGTPEFFYGPPNTKTTGTPCSRLRCRDCKAQHGELQLTKAQAVQVWNENQEGE